MKYLVTGGAGFIGSALVRKIITETDGHVCNVDLLTYAGDLSTVAPVSTDPRYSFVQGNIGDAGLMREVLKEFQPDAIINLAAETHVDRSIDGPGAFIETNIVGTYVLLEEARRYWSGLPSSKGEVFRFVHVSTDEVFGSLGDTGSFTEDSPYAPNSPYSASKASANHLVRGWHQTYGLPTIITACSNNYGPFQFPEKLIPVIILNALDGQPLPIYGDGLQVRDWLHVDDHAEALLMLAGQASAGSVYNIGGSAERTNLDLVRQICTLMDEFRPAGRKHEDLISFVEDRPGHDRRYSIDATLINRDLGWSPSHTLEAGLRETVKWYLDEMDWVTAMRKKHDVTKRLGRSSGASEQA